MWGEGCLAAMGFGLEPWERLERGQGAANKKARLGVVGLVLVAGVVRGCVLEPGRDTRPRFRDVGMED